MGPGRPGSPGSDAGRAPRDRTAVRLRAPSAGCGPDAGRPGGRCSRSRAHGPPVASSRPAGREVRALRRRTVGPEPGTATVLPSRLSRLPCHLVHSRVRDLGPDRRRSGRRPRRAVRRRSPGGDDPHGNDPWRHRQPRPRPRVPLADRARLVTACTRRAAQPDTPHDRLTRCGATPAGVRRSDTVDAPWSQLPSRGLPPRSDDTDAVS